jgi:lysophospholipase L1-like esterase
MRIKLIIAATVAALMCLAPAGALAQGQATGKQYYLALGDSLSRGAQPNTSGTTVPTNKGYANDLRAIEKKNYSDLTLQQLGCLGETTTTMMKGGICTYTAGSQLKQAVQFLQMHQGHIAFVTIDIGANDVDNCVVNGVVDFQCVAAGEASIQKNVPKIAAQLRKAAGTDVPIIGMTYYDPFLAAWLQGTDGQTLAAESQALAKAVNRLISNGYRSAPARFRVANVAQTFLTGKPFTVVTQLNPPGVTVPVAVANICQLTWMCAGSPQGPNIHANVAGYSAIAQTFAGKL